MRNDRSRILLVFGLLMGLTALATTWLPDVAYTGFITLRTDALPAQVGGFHGMDILYCQNERCLAVHPAESLDNRTACPRCQGRLEMTSLAERVILPPDTCILKKQYRDDSGKETLVTVVFSAENQRSIHRPQRCLPGQGFVIENTETVTVPLPGRNPLEIMVLTVRQQAASGSRFSHLLTFAYWYVGGDYETPSHYDRLSRTALDRIFRNRLDRWAYVSLSVSHAAGDDPWPWLRGFITDLYPLIQSPSAAGSRR